VSDSARVDTGGRSTFILRKRLQSKCFSKDEGAEVMPRAAEACQLSSAPSPAAAQRQIFADGAFLLRTDVKCKQVARIERSEIRVCRRRWRPDPGFAPLNPGYARCSRSQHVTPRLRDQPITGALAHQMGKAREMQVHAGDQQPVGRGHVEHLAARGGREVPLVASWAF